MSSVIRRFRGLVVRTKTFLTYFSFILLYLSMPVLSANPADGTGSPVTESTPDHSKPAAQVYKNIQVLKGIPSDELIPAMQFVAASLGVECSFCHVEHHFDQDDKKPKQTARKMIQMEMTIDGRDFSNQLKVTCNTCHRGTRNPVSVPAIRDTDLAQVPSPPQESPDAILPNAD
jgi:hypothetical protein